MRIALIEDSIVLKVLGNLDPTYYIRNKLLSYYPGLDTPSVLRKLKDMEKRGLITRSKSPYFLNNISWKAN